MSELKLLIDENLSPSLVQKLALIGIPAQHVAHVGLAGQPDAVVWAYASARDFAVLTLNAADFFTLADRVEVHPGAIVLRRAGLNRDEQWVQLKSALAQIDLRASWVNKVFEVSVDGSVLVHEIPQL